MPVSTQLYWKQLCQAIIKHELFLFTMRVRLIPNKHGFTLIETIISITIFGIVGILMIGIVGQGIKIYESIFNSKEIMDNISLTQKRFNNDAFGIRDISHILYADKTKFSFINSNLEPIQYRYDNNEGKFYRSQNNDGEYLIAQYLTDPTRFFYYTAGDALINQDPLDTNNVLLIWQIRLDLYAAKGSQTMNIQTTIFPQNLKYGVVDD